MLGLIVQCPSSGDARVNDRLRSVVISIDKHIRNVLAEKAGLGNAIDESLVRPMII